MLWYAAQSGHEKVSAWKYFPKQLFDLGMTILEDLDFFFAPALAAGSAGNPAGEPTHAALAELKQTAMP